MSYLFISTDRFGGKEELHYLEVFGALGDLFQWGYCSSFLYCPVTTVQESL